MKVLEQVKRTLKTQLWWSVTVLVILTVMEVTSLSGPNVCMVKQKYNITKRVKYRSPVSVRTYEWCFSVPPRCSKWSTEMRDVTRLETEERTAEMAVCCPGFKLKDVSCIAICPNGKTGHSCSEDCPPKKWGPNCVHDCKECDHGICDRTTGECRCQDGWQGERCETIISTTARAAAMMEQLLTTAKSIASTKTTEPITPLITTSRTTVATTGSAMVTVSTTSSHTTLSEQTETSIASSTEKVTQPLQATTTVLFTTDKDQESSTRISDSTQEIFTFSNNMTLSSYPTTLDTYKIITESDYRRRTLDKLNLNNNKTDLPFRKSTYTPTKMTVAMIPEATTLRKIIPETQPELTTSKPSTRATFASKATHPTTALTTSKEPMVTKVPQETKNTESTVKQPTTMKFKPKEIWIRPAQKGDTLITETKLKLTQELLYANSKAKEISEATTPKTIIVSIIPTSVSYVTFKKIALTTASSISQKNNTLATNLNRKSIYQGYTKPMIMQSTTPYMIKLQPKEMNSSTSSTITPLLVKNMTKAYTTTTRKSDKTIFSTIQTTNSMSSTLNVANKRLNSSSLTSVPSFLTNATRTSRNYYAPETSSSEIPSTAHSKKLISSTTEKAVTEDLSTSKQFVPVMETSTTTKPIRSEFNKALEVTQTLIRKETVTNKEKNLTNLYPITVSDNPSSNEETFHILTEPEHITAVMGDKEAERSTIDLISVISIAGGVMMAIITVAVVIVMLERCKKPRYEEVRKYNDIKMQVMIDNNDIPPPYVRSIFHTPLPDPPTSEKCHYQPITTLDRNLKQFMRPVVVQTISPLMLENFRGILECHYDHLPRRSQDMGTMPARCSVTPSINDTTELLPRRGHSLTDSDIEALKCEAKLDVIDNTTSEPLYAEIPCWRPPSAHAIEVVNVNGEAVTEL